jgi:hypothetical protein
VYLAWTCNGRSGTRTWRSVSGEHGQSGVPAAHLPMARALARQSGRTFSACGPFCPWVVSNSTFWFSASDR